MKIKANKKTLIFGIIYFILYFLIFGFLAFGLDLIPKANNFTKWINSNLNITFWFLLIFHTLCFLVYISYIYYNNIHIDDIVTTYNRNFDSTKNEFRKNIKKLEEDTETQWNKQNDMYVKSQAHLRFNEHQYIEIKYSVDSLKKEITLIQNNVLQNKKTDNELLH